MKPIPEMTAQRKMTDTELNEVLAVEVMGWHLDAGLWKDENGRAMYSAYAGEWHPTTDLNQAWECAEKYQGGKPFDLYKNNFNFGCECTLYGDDDHNIGLGIAPHPAHAICEAVLMTVRSER